MIVQKRPPSGALTATDGKEAGSSDSALTAAQGSKLPMMNRMLGMKSGPKDPLKAKLLKDRYGSPCSQLARIRANLPAAHCSFTMCDCVHSALRSATMTLPGLEEKSADTAAVSASAPGSSSATPSGKAALGRSVVAGNCKFESFRLS